MVFSVARYFLPRKITLLERNHHMQNYRLQLLCLALCQSISLGIPILRQSILVQAHHKETATTTNIRTIKDTLNIQCVFGVSFTGLSSLCTTLRHSSSSCSLSVLGKYIPLQYNCSSFSSRMASFLMVDLPGTAPGSCRFYCQLSTTDKTIYFNVLILKVTLVLKLVCTI